MNGKCKSWQGIRALREDLHALRLTSELADLWQAAALPPIRPQNARRFVGRSTLAVKYRHLRCKTVFFQGADSFSAEQKHTKRK